MKKYQLLSIIMFVLFYHAYAQTNDIKVTEQDLGVLATDALIANKIIKPAEQNSNGKVPDWDLLTAKVMVGYGNNAADRTITKAKMQYYYHKDWSLFCASVVHYTEFFVMNNDYSMLDAMAETILKNSDDPAQLKVAQRWAGLANAAEPQNKQYNKTFQAFYYKLGSK
jgi:hypothetical protein